MRYEDYFERSLELHRLKSASPRRHLRPTVEQFFAKLGELRKASARTDREELAQKVASIIGADFRGMSNHECRKKEDALVLEVMAMFEAALSVECVEPVTACDVKSEVTP